MLQHLHVKHLALIDEVEITFHEHLNILTGETGAGKSILIGSIESMLGKKLSKDMIRPGADSAEVELLFWIDDPKLIQFIEDQGIPVDDGEILLKRTMTEKRSINQMNHQTVTLRQLKEVAHRLFDLHGQKENLILLSKEYHLEMIDHFLDEQGKQEIVDCGGLLEEKKNLIAKMEELFHHSDQQAKDMDYLRFQINEIEAAQLCVNEDISLEEQYQRMIHGKDIITTCNQVREMTGDDDDTSLGNVLSKSLQHLQSITHLDEKANELYEELLQIEDLMNGFDQELNQYIEELDFNPSTFDEVEQRLNTINGLKDKYGSTIEEILNYYEKAHQQLDDLEHLDERKAEYEQQLHRIDEKYEKTAKSLTKKRTAIAKTMEDKITKALVDLNFLSVEFKINCCPGNPTPKGMDDIEILISTNPGLPLRPMEDVASGGELSRIMLAIKSVIADVDQMETLVFDEIDTGISGETAHRVAQKMSVISRDHQVIAITHLPQIAAMADCHYYIEKMTDQKQTSTQIKELNQEESLTEISRMISGDEQTQTSLDHAKEMKKLANEAKLY